MSSFDTSAVNSNFIGGMWGIDTPPSTVTDTQLATILASYLGPLPPYAKNANGYIVGAPFTTNMTLAIHDQVHQLLMDLQTPNAPNINVTLQNDLNAILLSAQTPQLPVYGQPAPLPPGSGGLARNTASALGSLIASLQSAGILSEVINKQISVNPTNLVANLTSWLSNPANLTLLQGVQTQLTQDVPTATGVINVNGTDQEIRIPLNQSLQAVLQTQYVQAGSSLVYSGLQALVDQQQGAEDSIRALNGLQQVYNGIQTIPQPTSLHVLSPNLSSIVDALNTNLFQNPTYSPLRVEEQILFPDGTSTISTLVGGITFSGGIGPGNVTIQGNTVIISSNTTAGLFTVTCNVDTNTGVVTVVPDTSGNFTIGLTDGSVMTNQVNALKTAISSFVSSYSDVNTLLKSFSTDPKDYLSDLPDILSSAFPSPGTTVGSILLNGLNLSLSVDPSQGNFLWLLNNLYKNYLNQSVQRLVANNNNIMVDPNMAIDPLTGQTQLILNSNVANNTTQQHNLLVIRSIQAYAYNMNIDGSAYPGGVNTNGSGTNNLISSSGVIPPASIPLIGTDPINPSATTVSLTDFGAATSGGLEASLATVLRNLVGPNAIFGLAGTGAEVDDGMVTANSSGINIANWILGSWSRDTPVKGIAVDQTQSYLSTAFSSAASLNDQLQQKLQQSFFLFQQFMQSATDTLSAINQLIVKRAQAISG